MLYALSLGVCDNPLDENELPFVYEKNLRVLPSMSSVLASSDLWIANKAFGVNFVKLLHGEQRARYISPLPPSAELRGEYRIGAVVDKGAGKGALVYFEKILSDNKTGDHLCTVSSTIFLRGDGGAGGFGGAESCFPERLLGRLFGYQEDGRQPTPEDLPDDFCATAHHTDKMIEFLRSTDEGTSWFAYMPYTAPHGDNFTVPDIVVDNRLENFGRPNSLIDHGRGFGEAASAPFKYYKGRYTEGGLRSAAFVHYPAVVAGGEVSNAFMTMMDISPNNSGELKKAVR